MRVWKFLILGMFLLTASNVFAAPTICISDQCISVEVVSNLSEMQKGLQYRDLLEQDHGMLFVFKDDDLHAFWMKDMRFAIDMLWIDRDYRIVTIMPSRLPCKPDAACESYTSTQNARYVLEVPAGFCAAHSINEGDTLTFKDIHI